MNISARPQLQLLHILPGYATQCMPVSTHLGKQAAQPEHSPDDRISGSDVRLRVSHAPRLALLLAGLLGSLGQLKLIL